MDLSQEMILSVLTANSSNPTFQRDPILGSLTRSIDFAKKIDMYRLSCDRQNNDSVGNCPKKHGLQKFITEDVTYYCNGCERRMNIRQTMWGCRRCNYDLCYQCFSKSKSYGNNINNIHNKHTNSSSQRSPHNIGNMNNLHNNKPSQQYGRSHSHKPLFTRHMTLEEANTLEINDKIDHRDQVGRFTYATVLGKQGTNLKIHYDGWSCKWNIWSNFELEIHKFAHAGSISKRSAHRFRQLEKGNYVDINPTQRHTGWKCGQIRRLDQKSGQIQVVYEFADKNYLYWAHLDNIYEIAEFRSKSGVEKIAKHSSGRGRGYGDRNGSGYNNSRKYNNNYSNGWNYHDNNSIRGRGGYRGGGRGQGRRDKRSYREDRPSHMHTPSLTTYNNDTYSSTTFRPTGIPQNIKRYDNIDKLCKKQQNKKHYSSKMYASEIANPYQHQKFREKSKSKHKDKKDVAHIVSRQMACFIQNKIPGPKPIDQLDKAVNARDFSNFKMILREVNRRQKNPVTENHEKIDRKILEIWKEVDKHGHTTLELNGTEAKRARQQAKLIQQLEFSSSFKKKARELYKSIPVRNNKFKAIWDDRRNKKADGLTEDKILAINGNKLHVSKRKQTQPKREQKQKYYRSNGSANGRELHIGSRGAKYYWNSNGNKSYVSNQTTNNYNSYDNVSNQTNVTSYHNATRTKNYDSYDNATGTNNYSGSNVTSYYRSNGSANGRELHTGSRGGTYYVNSNGNKTYV